MKASVTAVLVLAFGPAGCAAAPEPWRDKAPGFHKDPWADAPIGAWVRQRQILRYGGKERKWEGTLSRGEIRVEADPPRMGDFRAGPFCYVPPPACSRYVASRRVIGQEDVRVGEATYSCEVTEVELRWPGCGGLRLPEEFERAHAAHLRLWTSRDAPVPDGVLRWRMDDFTRQCEFRFASIDQPLEWRMRRVRAHEARYESRDLKDGAFETIVLVWSDEVPGRQLSYVREVKGGKESPDEFDRVETLDFGTR